MREVNEFRFAQLKEYLVESRLYTIENFMRKNGLLEDYTLRGSNSILASCPFHEDKNPSFSLNTHEDIFRCFSCGAHGRYLNFMHYYYLNKGEKVTIYDVAEKILKKDVLIQETLGFKTIYKSKLVTSDSFTYDDYIIKRDFKFNKEEVQVSYKIIAKRLKNASLEEKVAFVHRMQNGESPEDLNH